MRASSELAFTHTNGTISNEVTLRATLGSRRAAWNNKSTGHLAARIDCEGKLFPSTLDGIFTPVWTSLPRTCQIFGPGRRPNVGRRWPQTVTAAVGRRASRDRRDGGAWAGHCLLRGRHRDRVGHAPPASEFCSLPVPIMGGLPSNYPSCGTFWLQRAPPQRWPAGTCSPIAVSSDILDGTATEADVCP